MRRFLRILVRVLAVLFLLACAAAAFLWWKLRPHVEPIPASLPEVTVDVAAIRVPGVGLPDLRLGDLRGQTVYLVIDGRESMKAREGRSLNRALGRWIVPEGVVGVSIGDAEGLGFLSWKINQFVGMMRRESRLPFYVDYEGAVLRGFRLPRGHTGLVVLGPDGAVRYRHAGPLGDAELEEVRRLLGAAEPPPPPPAPEFAAGALTRDACRGRACALVFLARKVALREVPGVKGGHDGDDEKAAALLDDPSIRLVAALSDAALPDARASGVFVGDLDGVPLAAGWTRVADDTALRAALGVPAGEAALVVVDSLGRLAFREPGRIPFWKFGQVMDLLGVEE